MRLNYEVIYLYCAEHGISGKQFAQLVGISHQTLARIRGKKGEGCIYNTTPVVAGKIATAMGIDVKDLILK